MRAALLAVLAVALAACAGTAPRDASLTSSTQVTRQILLTLKQEPSVAVGLTGAPSQRYFQRRYGPAPSVDRVLSQIAQRHSLRRVDGWAIESLGVYCEVFEAPDGSDVDALIATLSQDSRVDLVQRMNLFTTQAMRYDDPYVDLQAAAVDLEVESAHALATGRGVSVAIIDSAIDTLHPDLRGRVRFARNLVNSQPYARSGEVHGTAVAGIIASIANNAEGIVGVAPDVSIAALRACWSVGSALAAQCSSFSLAQALEVALTVAPNVINMSLAGPADPLLSRLLDVAIRRGIVVVTAWPQQRSAEQAFPSSHPHVLAAQSSVEFVDQATPFVLPAPAREVLTTTPGDGYAFLTGNSLAAAHMTGVIALLMEREPGLDAERIADILTSTTTHRDGKTSINACRALARLGTPTHCEQRTAAARF